MILDGLTLTEGSTAQNLTVATGTSFPSIPNLGELFFNTTPATKGLYTYDGTIWDKVVFTSINLDTLLPSVGTAGTYKSVTTDSKGRVTAGTNPTTLAGFGIVDAQALDADLTAIAALVGTTGLLKKTAANTWTLDTSTYLIGNQTINISGDISGSGTTAIVLTLPATGVSAGTYKSVTVSSKGLVTAGTNPTTLAGYGIIDAQPLDADLTSLSNLLSTGIIVRSAADTFVTRILSVSGVGLGTSNADGTAGNPTITSNATSANTASTIVARDASGNFSATQITASLFGNATTATTLAAGKTFSLSTDATGTSGSFDGSGNVTIPMTLTTVNSNVGSFGSATQVASLTLDAKGRTTAASNISIAIPTSAVTSGTFADARIASSNVTQHQASLTILESQITDSTILARNAGNETISGSWTFSNVVVGATPTLGSHLTTKDYVDNIASGLDMKASCRAATTGPITLSGTQTIDGVAVIAGDRVLVKDQGTGSTNGIYVVAAGAWTRSTDADTSVEVTSGMYTFISEGTTNADTGWVLATNDPIVLNTTALVFTQFTGLGQITAGAGMTKTGTVLDVGTASSTRIVVNADNIDLATIGTAGTYKSITTDAYGRVTAGTNPTTLAGYGIADAQALDADLTAIAALAGTSGFLKKTALNTWSLDTTTYAPASTAVTAVSVVSANGVSGTATATTTPAITIALGAITPTSVASTGTISGTTITATTQFTGPATGLTGTAASLTAGTATTLAGGGTVSTTTGTFTGTLTVKTPPVAALITGATSGSIEIPAVTGISSATHATFLHQTTSVSAGFVQHVSLGSYRAGTANYDSFYIGIGGNDSNPTTKYSFSFDGILSHSTTGTFLNSTNYNTYAPTLTGTGASGTWGINISGSAATLTTGRTFSLSSDATGTSAAFTGAANVTIPMTLATVNSNVGSFGSASAVPIITVNAKGLITGVSTVGVSSAGASSTLTTANDVTTAVTVYPTWTTAISGNLSYFVSDTKLSFVPSTGVLTATKFAGAHNGSVGATTPSTGAFTTLSSTSNATLGDGTTAAQLNLNLNAPLANNALINWQSAGATKWSLYRLATSNNLQLDSNVVGSVMTFNNTTGAATFGYGLAVTGAVTGTSFNSITALSSTTPAALGVAAVGTSTTVARSDHVHLAPTTITGNAGSATNISGGGVGSLPYQLAASTTAMLAAGTNGQVLTLSAGVPSWAAAATGGATLSDDTTTNANTFYPTMASNQTSGAMTSAVVSSTKLSYNPSTGTLNATVFNSTSDERAKDNIRDIGYGLNEVLRMSGKKFEMKDGGQTSIGLIAQEVLKVIPEVVSENGEDRLGINYPVLTAVLIEAVKELTARVAELEQRCRVL